MESLVFVVVGGGGCGGVLLHWLEWLVLSSLFGDDDYCCFGCCGEVCWGLRW